MTDPATRVPTDAAEPAANGHPAPADHDAALARARRILDGDVRPDDYLPVPGEVRSAWGGEAARLADQGRIPVSPEAGQRMLNNWALQFWHGGQPVACRRAEQGVLVLAVGPEEIRAFLERFPNLDQRPGVVITTPPPWQPPDPPGSPNH